MSWSGLDASWELVEHVLNKYEIDDHVFDLFLAFEARSSKKHRFRWTSCKSFVHPQKGVENGCAYLIALIFILRPTNTDMSI